MQRYEQMKRENDEMLLRTLTSHWPHDDSTQTSRANIALEIYGARATLCTVLNIWYDDVKRIEKAFEDVNGIQNMANTSSEKPVRERAPRRKRPVQQQFPF